MHRAPPSRTFLPPRTPPYGILQITRALVRLLGDLVPYWCKTGTGALTGTGKGAMYKVQKLSRFILHGQRSGGVGCDCGTSFPCPHALTRAAGPHNPVLPLIPSSPGRRPCAPRPPHLLAVLPQRLDGVVPHHQPPPGRPARAP